MVSRTVRYSVRPRYTPGSPAQVPEALALRVLEEERRAHGNFLEGFCGEVLQREAGKLGLQNVVLAMIESRRGWTVQDLGANESWERRSNYKRGDTIEVFTSSGWERALVLHDGGCGCMVEVRLNPRGWGESLNVARHNTRDAASVRKEA